MATDAFIPQPNGVEDAYSINRLVNPQKAAEGTSFPPRMVANRRVPAPTNFRVIRQLEETGQTRFILGWFIDPMALRYSPTFSIYADQGPITATSERSALDTSMSDFFSGPWTANSPPLEVVIPGKSGERRIVRFRIDTRLSSGLKTDYEVESPSISVICNPL